MGTGTRRGPLPDGGVYSACVAWYELALDEVKRPSRQSYDAANDIFNVLPGNYSVRSRSALIRKGYFKATARFNGKDLLDPQRTGKYWTDGHEEAILRASKICQPF